MIKLSIEDGAFRRDMKKFMKKNDRDFQTAINGATMTLHRLAIKKVRQLAKKGTGTLRNNIRMAISGNKLTGTVISGAAHSQAFEEGTRPHTIRAKNKKVLAGPARGMKGQNVSGDYAFYGKQVQHPGTMPHPFMFPAWKFACNHLEKLIKKALS